MKSFVIQLGCEIVVSIALFLHKFTFKPYEMDCYKLFNFSLVVLLLPTVVYPKSFHFATWQLLTTNRNIPELSNV